MRRAVIVLTATGAGLALVLTYHPRSPLQGAASAATRASSPGASPGSGSPSAGGALSPSPSAGGGTRTAVGADEPIAGGQYGDIQVKVTVTNGRITDATTAALNTNDPRSQEIESIAVPQLEQQTIAAQSANIQGVSGATYGSQAYAASLQAALDKLR